MSQSPVTSHQSPAGWAGGRSMVRAAHTPKVAR